MTSELATVKRIEPSTVNGWGVDADPENDPTYPYREREFDDHSGQWVHPAKQDTGIEFLQSVEYNRRPAAFGTSSPPSGLSGSLRRLAFRWTESNLMHWMLLLGADRINVVEGVVADLGRAKVPNILGEMGARAEWQHNKAGFVKKAVIVTAVTGLIVGLVRSRSSKR
jgi:hypothetical protein